MKSLVMDPILKPVLASGGLRVGSVERGRQGGEGGGRGEGEGGEGGREGRREGGRRAGGEEREGGEERVREEKEGGGKIK